MSNILISPPPTTLLTGLLQLSGGVAISSTPVYVTDQNNTASPLALATANVNVNTTSGSALVNIQGTGNTTSTSALTIKDSTGANLFKFNDNGAMSIGLNSSPSTTANSLVVGLTTTNDQLTITSTQLSTSLPTLKLQAGGFSGTYIQASASGDYVGVGNSGFGVNAIPTSGTQRVVIKGWGSTSATTSLLVQNSSGSNSILTTDDGKSLLTATISNDAPLVVNNAYGWAGSYVARCQTWLSAGSEVARMMANGSMILTANVTASTFKATQNIPSDVSFGGNGSGNGMYMPAGNVTAIATNSTERLRVDASGNVGIGTTSPTAKLHIGGVSDASKGMIMSATTGILNVYPYYNSSYGVIMESRNSTDTAYQGMTFSGSKIFLTDGNVNINTGGTDLGGKLSLKGSGSTSATTTMLVQNSSATQLFKVLDDGGIEAGGSTATQFKIYNTDGLAIARDGSLNANIRIREFGAGGGPVFQMNGNSTPTFKMLDSSNFGCIQSHSTWTGIGKFSVENASACLQADSTTKGFLPPRMTTAQKLAITTPASGLMVYDTTLNQMSYYNNVTWINF